MQQNTTGQGSMNKGQIDAQSAQNLGEWAIKTVQSIATSPGSAVPSGSPQQVEQLGKQLYQAVRSYETTGKFTGADTTASSS